MENYVYSPVRSFFSFGASSAEEERLQKERESLAAYKQRYNDYMERAKATDFKEKVNAYPGYDENQVRKEDYAAKMSTNEERLKEKGRYDMN